MLATGIEVVRAHLSHLIRLNHRRHLLVQDPELYPTSPAGHRSHPKTRACGLGGCQMELLSTPVQAPARLASLALRLVKVVWVGRRMAGKPGIRANTILGSKISGR